MATRGEVGGLADVDLTRGSTRDHTPRRLFLLLAVVTVLAGATASVLVGQELEDRSLERLRARAARVAGAVGGALEGGRAPADPVIGELLAIGGGALVDIDGDVVAGGEPAPRFPPGADPRDAVSQQSILTAMGDDQLVAVVPLRNPGGLTVVVIEDSGPLRSQITRLRWLLGAVGAGLLALTTVGGWSLLHQSRLRLEERTRALMALLRRERETVERLGEVDAMKSALLTAVSHELRTPLTVVAAGAELLASRMDDLSPEQIQELTGRMDANAARLTRLIDDLLDIDRLARGVLQPDRQDVDIADLVERTVEGMAVPRDRVRLDLTGGTVSVDPGHVQRVVENLVRNALKFAPAGTPVDIWTATDGDAIEVVVADRGPGIADARKQTVFEPLRRHDESDPSPGLGVGLALVARLTELHGGRAWVSDRPGGGLEAHASFGGAVS